MSKNVNKVNSVKEAIELAKKNIEAEEAKTAPQEVVNEEVKTGAKEETPKTDNVPKDEPKDKPTIAELEERIQVARQKAVDVLNGKIAGREKMLSVRDLILFDEDIKTLHPAQRANESHDDAFIKALIESIMKGWKIGTITLAWCTDRNVWYTQDGQSRTESIRKALKGQVKGLTLEPHDRSKILNHLVDITYYQGTFEELAEQFALINKSKAMSALQKNKGKLAVGNSNLMEAIDELSKHKLWSMCLTDKQVKKEEPSAILETAIANIFDCYKSSNAKMVEELANCKTLLDVDKMMDILNRLAHVVYDMENKSLDKYPLIHFIHRMYLGTCLYRPLISGGKRTSVKSNFVQYDFDTTIIEGEMVESTLCKARFETQGANSAPQNTKRCTDMENYFGDYMHKGDDASTVNQTVIDPEML